MSAAAQLFHYYLDARVDSRRRGEHAGVGTGEDGVFRSHRPLASAADARRIDVRASLNDPLGRWWVREHQIRAATNVWLLADISASMRIPSAAAPNAEDPTASQSKAELLAALTLSCAQSSHAAGDRFGLVAGARELDRSLCMPATRQPAQAHALATRIRQLGAARGSQTHAASKYAVSKPAVDTQTVGEQLASAQGLLHAVNYIGNGRSLVFLASDFHGPAAQWQALLQSLRRHQVIALVLRDDAEWRALPPWGLVRLIDAETGRSRPLLMRPSLRRRILEELRCRDQALQQLFRQMQVGSVWFDGHFSGAQITDHFFGAAWVSRQSK